MTSPDADPADLDRLGAGKYLLVTTFRKDGRTVPTPVWVARDGDALGVWTAADSGKVKRIRNRGDVLLAPCDMRGRRLGDDIPGHAEILDAAAGDRYRRLARRKYGLVGLLATWGSKLRRDRDAVIGIRITLGEPTEK